MLRVVFMSFMPNITNIYTTYQQRFCNFHMYVFQIKLKYYCSKPIKLQKFLMYSSMMEEMNPTLERERKLRLPIALKRHH